VVTEVRSYKDLIVWQRSIELVKIVYELTHRFPKHETYALSDQLRRSVVSIPSNIAEGQKRQHPGEFRQFLYMAMGSAAEVNTQVIIAHELAYINQAELQNVENLIDEIEKMAYALLKRLPQRQT
jgi:four helix bundle protein